ncbi:MAG: SOS response-associated peptidase [Firmicutes bacterium HGW-Firmicutes-5]|nr:MAG: SOS response-associated peptidase [Firmicutes bacterium HGW-Firmicutes-5]
MCGRYTLYSETEDQEIRRIVAAVNRRYDEQIKPGDILPSDLAPVISGDRRDINQNLLELMNWGYENPFKKGLIINARSESILEKSLFHDDFKQRRCLIPATGFYEWDTEKRQYLFQTDQLLYLAGIYRSFMGSNKFVILTKPPNETVKTVHDRMPVLIPPAQRDEWLKDLTAAVELTKNDTVTLTGQVVNQVRVNTQIKFPLDYES